MRHKLKKILCKYDNLFILGNDSLGLIPDVEHCIDTGDSLPIKSRM